MLAHWRAEPGRLEGVAATGMADSGWLAGMLAGTCGADVATVGFLANLQVIAETLGAPAGTAAMLIT